MVQVKHKMHAFFYVLTVFPVKILFHSQISRNIMDAFNSLFIAFALVWISINHYCFSVDLDVYKGFYDFSLFNHC